MFNNIDTARSYATEENLLKALAKYQLQERQLMVVRNRAGRYTAIIMLDRGEFHVGYAQQGFKTIAM